MDNPLYDPEYCYECTGYGDDYYEDENGQLKCRCEECMCGPYYSSEDD